MIRFIILAVPLLDVAWFLWAWWRTARFPHKIWWRGAITAFFLLMLIHFLWMMLFRRYHVSAGPPPVTLGMAYIWHLLVVPVIAVLITLAEVLLIGKQAILKKVSAAKSDKKVADDGALSRRQFLAITAVAAPPAITILAGIGGYAQSKQFRIRRLEVETPLLPPELDGVTIAQVSDIHAGKFADEKHLARIVAGVNNLRADMIVLPGDLIDFSLADLPGAVEAVRRMDARHGVFLCEGNHDLFEGREQFEKGVKSAGLALLINESANLRLRGRDVQIHGLRWGNTTDRRDHSDDAGAVENLTLLQESINPEAFNILLAHHPHAFDAASALGLPLTLAGHTHGGQLMLTPDVGAGPLMYRYWSGLYRQGASRLVVSNGAGNWLPLRINAPAEIVHITLRATAVA